MKKPPYRPSVTRSPLSWVRKFRPRITEILVVSLGLAIADRCYLAAAADGTWTNTTSGGLWSTPANWTSTTVADGLGATANFNTIDITVDNTVHLDTARTIGNLIFGDTDTTTAAAWMLDNNSSSANVLTLAVGSGAPSITVNALGTGKVVTLNLELAGTQGLSKAGAGELVLSGVNSYSGTTTVNAGTLTLMGSGGTGGTILNSANITIAQGATLKVSSDATNGVSTNRIADNAAITMNGGLFQTVVSTTASTVYGETVGALNITSGGNRISNGNATGAGSTSTLTFASLNRSAGATLTFSNTTSIATTANKILFTLAPTLDDGGLIGGWAMVGSADFATYGANGVAIASYSANSGTETTWSQADNIKISSSKTLTGSRQINALAMAQSSSTTLDLGGFTLRVESGGVLASGGTVSPVITNGTLTAGNGDNVAGELFLMSSQANTRPLTVSANITDNGSGVVSLVVNGGISGGTGAVILGGVNAYTGTTTVAGGGLLVSNSTALNNSNTFTVVAGASLTLQGNTVTVDGLWGSGTVGTGAFSGSVLSLGNNNGSATFSGTFAVGSSGRNLNIVKNGTGTQLVTGTDGRDTTTSGSPSTTTINAGTLQFAKQVSLYNNNTARWTATNIVVNSGATLALNVGGTGEFTSANVDTLKALGSATGGFKNGAILGLDTTNAAGGTFTYSSAIANPNVGANSIGVTKLGAGTLVLAGTSTYTGPTSVNAGELLVTGSINGSTTTVNSGGLFGGTGSAGGIVLNAGGAIEAGSTSDDLAASSLVWNGETSGAFAQMKFELSSVSSASDRLTLSGTLTKGTGSTFLFDFQNEGAFSTSYTLLTFASQSGFSASDFSYTNLAAGLSGSFALQGNALVFNVVPEPASGVSLLGGLGCLLGLQRFRRKGLRQNS